jgi:hypothetical protein
MEQNVACTHELVYIKDETFILVSFPHLLSPLNYWLGFTLIFFFLIPNLSKKEELLNNMRCTK